MLLSSVLQNISNTKKYNNFDLGYIDNPMGEGEFAPLCVLRH